ncbi:MAG: DUF1292 domain-containing protein [Clostridia bacterium]
MSENNQNTLPEEDEPIIIKFQDDEGNDIELELLDVIDHKAARYAVLLPVEETDEAGDVLIFKVEAIPGEDQDMYLALEDEDLEIEIFEIFKDHFADEFNFVD